MGLSIYLLADSWEDHREGSLKQINRGLAARKLPPYDEPKISIPGNVELPSIEWLYSTSRCLNLLTAKFIEDPSWTLPTHQEDYHPISEVVYQEILKNSESHILGMPHESGYYLPIPSRSLSLRPYPSLGSSIAFYHELRELAARLNFDLFDLDDYTPKLGMSADHRTRQKLRKELFGEEKWVLLALYTMATASLHYRSAICFSG